MEKDEYTIAEHLLDVGDGHKIYTQLWGNPSAGRPIIATHGGPGGQMKQKHKQLYNPKIHKILFIDQRGCGKSTPVGSITNNTIRDLLDDITKAADYYKIDKFSICGGSWASTIALAYAIHQPQRVDILYIDGIFTASKSESDYLERGRYQNHFPDIWQQYLSSSPIEFHNNPDQYHFKRILGDDERAAKESAYAHSMHEYSLLNLDSGPITSPMPEDFDYLPTKIYSHYASNQFFLSKDYVLKNASKIKAKTYMLQGRYDMLCPPTTAYELNELVPDSQIIWTMAGHVDRSTLDAKKAMLATHQ